MAEAAAGGDPADLGDTRIAPTVARWICAVDGPRLGRRRGGIGTEIGPSASGHERVRRGPLDGRKRNQRSSLAHRLFRAVGGAAVSGRPEHRDAVRRRGLEGIAQVLERLRAAEGLLGGGEALRDHLHLVVVDQVLLGLHHVREALNSEGLRSRRRDEQDVRHRGDGVDELDVERDLERPGRLILETRSVAGGRRGGRAVRMEDVELRHPRLARHALLAAHRGEAERLVVDVEVVLDRVASPRVHDRDRHAGSVRARVVQGLQVVGRADARGREAPATDGEALRFGRRRLARGDELVVAHGRLRRRECPGRRARRPPRRRPPSLRSRQ